MSSLFRIYTDCLANFIDVFLFFRFVDNNRQEKASVKYKIFILCLYFLYSVPNFYIPAFSTIIDFFFLIVITYPELKKSFCIFIKFQIYAYTSMTIILFLHSLLFNDRITLFTSTIYEEYKFIIVSFLTYIFYVLYSNYKKNRKIRSHYYLYFSVIILAVCLLLSYATLYICRREPESQIMPLLFSTLIILVLLCISLYDKFLVLIEENANYKMQAEINRLQTDYALQIDENLKILRSVRHDIKNHLIIIDGYAAQKKFEKIHEYISRIGDRFKDTAPIQTSSTAVSAILNEKSALAQQKNISCEITCNFPSLKIDDFTMITILGNLLDNAITAASKCSDGWIKADLQQEDSILVITIDNSHAEEIQEKDGVFTSTKADTADIHGIGIKNVRKAVNDLRGQIEITYTENTFYVCIMLPNYK